MARQCIINAQVCSRTDLLACRRAARRPSTITPAAAPCAPRRRCTSRALGAHHGRCCRRPLSGRTGTGSRSRRPPLRSCTIQAQSGRTGRWHPHHRPRRRRRLPPHSGRPDRWHCWPGRWPRRACTRRRPSSQKLHGPRRRSCAQESRRSVASRCPICRGHRGRRKPCSRWRSRARGPRHRRRHRRRRWRGMAGA